MCIIGLTHLIYRYGFISELNVICEIEFTLLLFNFASFRVNTLHLPTSTSKFLSMEISQYFEVNMNSLLKHLIVPWTFQNIFYNLCINQAVGTNWLTYFINSRSISPFRFAGSFAYSFDRFKTLQLICKKGYSEYLLEKIEISSSLDIFNFLVNS